MIELFFSYSHKDETLRDDLETHLAMLKRQGLIQAYHDRRISSGSELDKEIDAAMMRAGIILLLVSPDFLASEYCYGVEISKAIEKHKDGSAIVIPVILRPCEWQQVPLFSKLMGAPTDNKPVTKWADQDDAFLDITKRIRNAISEVQPKSPAKPELINPNIASPVISRPRSSNLTIKTTLTDHDKDKFLDEGFTYIRNFFESSLSELEGRHADIATRFIDNGGQSFSATVYRDGKKESAISVFAGGSFGGRSVSYVSKETPDRNSSNGSLSVNEDEGRLYFDQSMWMFSQNSEKLSFLGASELFWSTLIAPLQR